MPSYRILMRLSATQLPMNMSWEPNCRMLIHINMTQMPKQRAQRRSRRVLILTNVMQTHLCMMIMTIYLWTSTHRWLIVIAINTTLSPTSRITMSNYEMMLPACRIACHCRWFLCSMKSTNSRTMTKCLEMLMPRNLLVIPMCTIKTPRSRITMTRHRILMPRHVAQLFLFLQMMLCVMFML